jgi:flagellar hook protein FlgE
VSYTNGQQLEVAQVVTANFNAVNALKRMDGGVFAATSESGEPLLGTDGIIGSAVEASNTDISEEFTKLIVTRSTRPARASSRPLTRCCGSAVRQVGFL